MHNVSINIVRKKNIYIHLSQKIYSTIESHNANQFSSTELDPSLRASRNTRGFNLEKKKALSTSRLSSNSKRKEEKKKKERKKERGGKKNSRKEQRWSFPRRGERRESIGMRGNFKSPLLQVLASENFRAWVCSYSTELATQLHP